MKLSDVIYQTLIKWQVVVETKECSESIIYVE